MIVLEILEIRKFMNMFLLGELFDGFTMTEGQITTFCTYTIDGRYEREFFGETEDSLPDAEGESGRQYVRWGDVKPRCLDLIRGKRTPLRFRFVFYYPEEKVPGLLGKQGVRDAAASVSGLCLNLRFGGKRLLVTTGTSRRSFTTDRTAENAWDDYVRDFLKSAGAAFREEIS